MDYKHVFESLVSAVAKYCIDNNIKSTILGISGGIDSTIVAAILSEVEKQYNITFYGVSLPSKTTDPNELNVANLVGQHFCSKFSTISIDESSNHLGNILVHKELGIIECPLRVQDKRRFGNIKSRLRMIYLYDFAARYNGIVIGTDNYTEYLLGFSTIGGDALYDLCPIKYLWKTEIYKLGEYLIDHYIKTNQLDKKYALFCSIRLTPQDGLGISKSDFEQFGVDSYDRVDEILCNHIHQIPNTGDVGKVIELYEKNAFKRNHPIDIKRQVYEGGIITGLL